MIQSSSFNFLRLQTCVMALSFSISKTYFLFFIVFVIVVLLFKKLKRVKNTLPGPRKLPVIGNLHQLGKLPHRSLRELAGKHGPLMFLQLGQIQALVVSSANMAREIMKNHDLALSSRPSHAATKILFYGCTDVAFTPYGEYWRQVRKICMLELFSAKRVQSFRFIIEEEISKLIACIANSSAGLVNMSELVLSLTNNIICRVAFSKFYGGEKGEYQNSRLFEILKESQTLVGGFCVGNYFPSLQWIDIITGFHARVLKNFVDLDGFFEEVIEEHLESNRQPVQQEDLVDVLLRVQKDHVLEVPFGRDNIKAILKDLFIAGTDTTYATIIWAMTELMRNPRTMKKAQDEVRRVIGKKEKIEESDLHQLHFLKLVIKEVFRLHPPAPLPIARESINQWNIDGYEIFPKTRVFVNAWAIGRDPQTWEKPEEFWPERFVNSSIDFRGGHNFELIPFGAGRRGCPAISFATMMLEHALANLLHSFDWDLPSGMSRKDLDMIEEPGLTVYKKFPLFLVARFHNHM